MGEYIGFKRFITPTFIMIIYILGALLVTIGSILLMVGGVSGLGVSMGGGISVVIGVVVLIFGNLFWRILCEYWVVQFRIYEELHSLNHRMGGPATPTMPQTAPPAPTSAPATPTCPTCGSPLRYIQQYQRWYCDREQKYV